MLEYLEKLLIEHHVQTSLSKARTAFRRATSYGLIKERLSQSDDVLDDSISKSSEELERILEGIYAPERSDADKKYYDQLVAPISTHCLSEIGKWALSRSATVNKPDVVWARSYLKMLRSIVNITANSGLDLTNQNASLAMSNLLPICAHPIVNKRYSEGRRGALMEYTMQLRRTWQITNLRPEVRVQMVEAIANGIEFVDSKDMWPDEAIRSVLVEQYLK